jgi:hypothetical protein
MRWAWGFRVKGDFRARLALLALVEDWPERAFLIPAGEALIARLCERTAMSALDVRNALLRLEGWGALEGRDGMLRMRWGMPGAAETTVETRADSARGEAS